MWSVSKLGGLAGVFQQIFHLLIVYYHIKVAQHQLIENNSFLKVQVPFRRFFWLYLIMVEISKRVLL